MKTLKVLGAYRSDAAGYYRLAAPFSVLSARTHHTFNVSVANVEAAQEYDVLWLQQHADPVAEIVAREFKAAGRMVIYDVDDWLFGIPPSWPSYGQFYERGSGEWRDRLYYHDRLLKLADVVTCPTEILAEQLRGGLGLNDVRVLPNCILQGDWDTVIPATHDRDGPVLGWFGTYNHWDDWMEIAGAVDEGLAAVDGYLALVGAPEMVIAFPPRLAERTFVVPLVRMRDFGDIRRLIKSFDAGLAWCTDRLKASWCRSPLKAIQYGAAGVPLIASDTVYGFLLDTLDPDEYGLVVSGPRNLHKAIRYALTQTEWVSKVARRWQQRVWERHSYETQALRWLDVLGVDWPEEPPEEYTFNDDDGAEG